MPRKYRNASRFQFKIVVKPRNAAPEAKPWIGTGQWKHRAIYLTRMRFWCQAKKALIRSRFSWYKFYAVFGYEAPSEIEFICPYTGMVATTVLQCEAASFRKYWLDCYSKSVEIINWLDTLDKGRYTKELNSYLLQLIVVKPPILSERKRYESEFQFKETKPWQMSKS